MTIQEMYIPSVNAAVDLIQQYYSDRNYSDLRTVKEYLENGTVSSFIAGDADRFHNATVGLARIGFYDYAYALAEVGNRRYPKNTDLLGDLLGYGLQCRQLRELEKWYNGPGGLKSINQRFWTWRAYQFSFDYWMERLPEASDEQLAQWEKEIEWIFSTFKTNFCFLKDKSNCEKAYMMEFEYYTSKGMEAKAINALERATEDNQTKNKCPQCALKLADRYFELGDYNNALKYADVAVGIKEDQSSISLGYTHYIRAMSKEYVERQLHSASQNIADIYNAYYSAYLYLDSEHRMHLIDSVKKQVKMLEREFGVESGIPFDEQDFSDMERLLRELQQHAKTDNYVDDKE